jgi:hypothetical protein
MLGQLENSKLKKFLMRNYYTVIWNIKIKRLRSADEETT